MKFEKKVIDGVAAKYKAVNDLIALGILSELTAEPNIYLYRAFLNGKDKTYLKNFCKNILTVWAVTFKPSNWRKVELCVWDKESGDLICKYGEDIGLVFS